MSPQQCPAGCGESFGTENGAVMHAVNKQDSEHSGIGSKVDAYDALEGSTNQETADRPSGSQEEAADDSRSNPAFDSPAPDDSKQKAGCPECPSTDWYDAATVEAHPELPDDVPGDRVCAECGEVFDNE